MASDLRYRRVLLKLSGEVLGGSGGTGIDDAALTFAAEEIGNLQRAGAQVAVMVGGGNFLRGRQFAAHEHIRRTTADTMGMLATTINALALQDRLEGAGVPARAMGTVSRPEVCEPFIRRHAIEHLEQGRVVVLAGGTGSPFFTTDTGASLRAAELDVEALLKATNVDGVYSADPKKDASAKRFERLTYLQVLERQLRVMDLTAISMCMDLKLPVIVFSFARAGNLARAARGEDVGTTITA